MLTERRSEIAKPAHVGEPICEDTGEGGRHGADQVEDCVAFLEIVARIPAGKEICTALSIDGLETGSLEYHRESQTYWEEACFKNTKYHAEADHLVPSRKRKSDTSSTKPLEMLTGEGPLLLCQEPKTQHDDSPANSDGRQEDLRPDFAKDDGRRGLEKNISGDMRVSSLCMMLLDGENWAKETYGMKKMSEMME